MKKKIVMVGNTAWGMHKFRSDLMNELIRSGHDVFVLAPYDIWASEIEKMGCKFIDAKVDRKGTNPFSDLIYLSRLICSFLIIKPDIVLSYTIKPVLYGTMAAWFAGVPQRIAITTGLGYVFSKNNFISKVTKILYKISLHFASQVWFLNSDDLNIFLNQKLVSESKVFILPGEGVDVQYFTPQKKESDDINFTLISRMLWDKGIGIFAECAKELKATHPLINFQIVGPIDHGNPEGISIEVLNDWHNQGHIKYLGSSEDIRPILKETTCLVHPTYYKEGLPRILMEANSMGIPCITTDIPGCRDVIEDNINGFLIKSKDKAALKEAIIKFLELDETKKKVLSVTGRERIVKNFSSDRIFEIYQEKLS